MDGNKERRNSSIIQRLERLPELLESIRASIPPEEDKKETLRLQLAAEMQTVKPEDRDRNLVDPRYR